MDKQYYKEYYYLEREHWWFRARMEIIEGLFRKHIAPATKKGHPLKILNVGVATGATSLMLQKYGDVTSLEYDAECCEFLRETVGLEPINASLTELPFKNETFDVICAFDVIEHIENDSKAIQEIYRTLKQNGYIYLTVPAFMSLWSHHDKVNHHYRRYTINTLTSVVLSQKFSMVYKTYFNSVLFIPIFLMRQLSRFLNREKKTDSSGSDFDFFKEKKTLNAILYRIFKTELPLLKRKISFPFGVSALLIGQKNESAKK